MDKKGEKMKENKKSIYRLKVALFAIVGYLVILTTCVLIAIESLWTTII